MAITITPRVTAATAISTGQMEITGPNGLTIDPTSASDDSKILFQLQNADHFTLGVDQSVTNDPLTLVRGTNLAANRIWSVADNADTFNIHSAVDLGSNTLTSTGSMQIRTIDYSDGDLAMTIADGGAVTMNKSASGASYTYLDGNAGQNT